MTVLRESDVRALLDLVGMVSDADDLPEFRRALLEAVPGLVPTDYVSYNEVSATDGPTATLVAPELPAWAYDVWARYGLQNPLYILHGRTRDGRAYRFSDVIARERLEALELHRELYRPLGIEHQLAFCLPSTPSYTVATALSRGGPDFTQRDRDVLNLARPHLIQAYRHAELRERTREILEAVRRGLDDVDQALVVLEGGDRIAFASAAALRLLRAACDHDGGATLPAPLRDWLRAGAAVPLVLEAPRPVAVRYLAGKGDRPGVLFLEPGMRRVGPSVLRGLGLTPREAEVLHLIVRGHANQAIAAELQISPRTVHKHVEHVFAKLGVGSRLEAVATVWAAVGRGEPGFPR